MPNFIKNILKRKVWSAVIVVVLVAVGYWGYGKFTATGGVTRYVLAAVQKGTLITSVSGSGQVAALNQVNINPNTSGTLINVNVKNGQAVSLGALLATIDPTDAQRALRSAQTSFDNAKLDLATLIAPPDALTLAQAQDAITSANQSQQQAKNTLENAYTNGYTTVSSAFIDLPSVMSGLKSMFFSNTIDKSSDNITWYVNRISYLDEQYNKVLQYRDDFVSAYNTASVVYNKSLNNYKSTPRNSDTSTIESLISETYQTSTTTAEALRSASNFISFVDYLLQQHNSTVPSIITSNENTLNTYTSTTNGDISGLFSITQSIINGKASLVSAGNTLNERTLSLQQLQQGPTDLQIAQKKLAVQQSEDNLITAQKNLADDYILAPFAGVIAKINVLKGNQVSSGTVIATLVTAKKVANITLNEVDAAKVSVGQKATLTFDAIPNFTITGEVAEVDTLGAISQGVVTYAVQITYDTGDDRVKPGMSVTANIIIDAKQDVLLVPNATVKLQGSARYVQIPSETVPAQGATSRSGVVLAVSPANQMVEVGASNDQFTEITSGLKEGDLVVVSTINPTAASTTTSSGSALRIPGLGGGGGFRGN